MKHEYDFSDAKRGAVGSSKGKSRITIMLDDAVLKAARSRAESEGYGYQTVINSTLRHALLHEDGQTGSLKSGLTANELKALERKLTDAVNEIQRLIAPGVQP